MAQGAWETLTIQDNFIFCRVMETYPDICKRLLEKILRMEIERIDFPEREKSIEVRHDSKGIRLDVFVKTSDGLKCFDMEIQTARRDDLPRRIRYYQGLIDMDFLEKGKYYWQLGSSYIIFICVFDYFGKGRHIYTFHERCDEDMSIELATGTTKIFLNAYGTIDDVDDEVKAFLDYVAGKEVQHPLVDKLDAAVKIVKQSKKWREEYMRYETELAAREHLGREEGREEGAEIATLNNLRAIIEKFHLSKEDAMDTFNIPMNLRTKYLSQL